MRDLRGLPISGGNQKTLAVFERALFSLNGFYLDPLKEIEEGLSSDPDFPIGWCLRGALYALSTDRRYLSEVKRSVSELMRLSSFLNERERLHYMALQSWATGEFCAAQSVYGRILQDWPHDLMAMQLAHQVDFFVGDTRQQRDRIAACLPEWDDGVPGYGYVLGMYAFGLEEMNEYARAEEVGRRAVDLNPRDIWAVHAVAHVMEMQGRARDGVRWLGATEAEWADGNMLAGHNWWHKALLLLDLDDISSVLEILDKKIYKPGGDVVFNLCDVSSLLWRLWLRGVDVGGRWSSISAIWPTVVDGGHYIFNDVHAMMAYVADGRMAQAESLMLSVKATGLSGFGTNADVIRQVGERIVEAIHAFGSESFDRVVDCLMSVRGKMYLIGGSHAQRDVLVLTLIEAALRSGQVSLARMLSNERIMARPSSPANWRLLARAARQGKDTGTALAAEAKASAVLIPA